MAYLRLRDYERQIQDVNLNQIISSDPSNRLLTELDAQAEMISYLVQKYDCSDEFRDTVVFSSFETYKAKQLIELNSELYNPAFSYSVGDLTVYNNNVYIAIFGTTSTYYPPHWSLIGKQYELFYVSTPKPEFDNKKIYKPNDQVFWRDKTHTCIKGTLVPSYEGNIQFNSYADIPSLNVFPDDSVSGLSYWGAGVAYTITAGTLPTNNAKWAKGDNRNPQMVRKMVSVVLFFLHDRISPRNIPQQRKDNYDSTIVWLNAAARGDVTADLPLLQPKRGARIRHGGNVKQINSY